MNGDSSRIKKEKAKKWLRRGSGSLMYGISITLVATTLLYLLIQNFIIYTKHLNAQNAVDALSDGLAINTVIYMNEYEDTEKYVPELKNIINNEMNANLVNVKMDSEKFKKDVIQIEATTINSDLYAKNFIVKKDASTKFYRYGLANGYVSMAIQMSFDPLMWYSQGDRLYVYNSTGTHNTDCSSFVYYALFMSGYLQGESATSPFTTVTMGDILSRHGFSRVGSSSEVELRPGDILIRHDNGQSGNNDHTEIYIGNGQNVGNHGVSTGPGIGGCSGEWASVYRLTGY